MINGLRVGHTTLPEYGTGVSVFLFATPAVGAYWIAGSAPATHELVVLDPENSVPEFHGLVLSGGSAYGLFSALGVMRYLTEQDLGHPTLHGVVPIVPAAAIYDLDYQAAHAPHSDHAYAACLNATVNNKEMGQIGAATGARIGKVIPDGLQMQGGLGFAELHLDNDIYVCAYSVVNCIGDVMDENGQIIAGAKTAEGEFANCNAYLLQGREEKEFFANTNTTLAVVFTNAVFKKDELKRIAKMAVAGMGKALAPAFTRYDGDLIFCVSLGNKVCSELTIGAMAAEAVRQSIVNAVAKSTVIKLKP